MPATSSAVKTAALLKSNGLLVEMCGGRGCAGKVSVVSVMIYVLETKKPGAGPGGGLKQEFFGGAPERPWSNNLPFIGNDMIAEEIGQAIECEAGGNQPSGEVKHVDFLVIISKKWTDMSR